MEKPKRKNKPRRTRGVKRELNKTQVLKLARLACTVGEIADFFDVSEDTIQRNYAEEVRKGNSHGNISLRRAQFVSAVQKLNPVMLIWLGKQRLNQADKFDVVDSRDGGGFGFVKKKADE